MSPSTAHLRWLPVALAVLVAAMLVTLAALRAAPGRDRTGAPSSTGGGGLASIDVAELQWYVLRGGPPARVTPIPAPARAPVVTERLVDQYRPAGHRVYRERPAGFAPKVIVLHATGSGEPGSEFASARALGAFFDRPSTRAASHYGVDRAGRIVRYVDEADAAFHVATPGWNDISIGIELLNDNSGRQAYPAVQLDVARRLVQVIAARHTIPLEGVVTHASVQPSDRRDPVGFPWRSWRASLVAR